MRGGGEEEEEREGREGKDRVKGVYGVTYKCLMCSLIPNLH